MKTSSPEKKRFILEFHVITNTERPRGIPLPNGGTSSKGAAVREVEAVKKIEGGVN